MRRTRTDQGRVASLARESGPGRRLSRYDVVLGAIPLLLSTSAVGAFVSDLSLEPLIAPAAVLCLLAIVDVLFVHPPEGSDDAEGVDGRESSPERTGR